MSGRFAGAVTFFSRECTSRGLCDFRDWFVEIAGLRWGFGEFDDQRNLSDYMASSPSLITVVSLLSTLLEFSSFLLYDKNTASDKRFFSNGSVKIPPSRKKPKYSNDRSEYIRIDLVLASMDSPSDYTCEKK